MIRAVGPSIEQHVDAPDGSDDEQFERLSRASVALRARGWMATELRSMGSALRATVLELAELIDAASAARSSLAGIEVRTVTYLDRLDRFVTQATEAVVAMAFDPTANVGDRLSEALELWEEQVPWNVMCEIAQDGSVERHIDETSAAWELAARGLSHLRAHPMRPMRRRRPVEGGRTFGPDRSSSAGSNSAPATLPDIVSCCDEARGLALQIEQILAEADLIPEQHGALRLAEALTGTLLDKLGSRNRPVSSSPDRLPEALRYPR